MIFDESTTSFENNYSERNNFGAIKEIRPGRKIFCRKITSEFDSSPEKNEYLHILFVHGSCAASSQYDALISQMSDAMKQRRRSDENDQRKCEDELRCRSMHCYLYDQLGCARSSQHPTSDWDAYSSEELLLDLKAITQSILQQNQRGIENKDLNSLYIVAHSHGVSQAIKLVVDYLSPSESSKIKGLILIGGALKDGPASAQTQDGGHWIFRYIPMFLLRKMQPSLSKSFIEAAVHPSNLDRLRRSGALDISDKNDMAMCKAFYRQQKYATAAQASNVKVRIFVQHFILLNRRSIGRCL